MITAIPAGVGQTVCTHGYRPPLLENWLAKPFLSIAMEDFYITPHGSSCSVLPRIAWGLIFELFGYEPGAFTGAKQSGHPGKIEQANGGTLFLDEIAELPMEVQVALLRVLQDHTVTRVGGIKPIKVNVRIVTATHADLWQMVRNGTFRSDLFYRLQGIHITLPPLRKRTDRLYIGRLLLDSIKGELGYSQLRLSSKVERFIDDYHWPGNIRQLESVMREAAFLSKDGLIDLDCLPHYILSDFSCTESGKSTLKRTEEETIEQVLRQTGGNISEAARILGIGRNTLYRKMRKR
ncbi:sigma-54-dependent Fis family transcriptional regulator [Alicyclobacillus cycloheptanicus]|uniref:Transcriptional regulator with PAS, ATPase and Fis domain n=1 Tax=Alicyclobacillus cycloheptanicus TaxID=1457 RepID=A0ABT9XPF7_9BACL|nr:sigma 54-interacting transcriptional regulator [Alicyclobacillus cycloheptanicus]MDQ0191643.1 transcriptional regulator with PAS, ATPase and Fis domain [Alicyclobacillus cycloheptanicus]WDM00133.1 sigma-54-dependent Fis family transcriptional regulator [Alicyclobacillus cycloheptanicus]